jgi:hypothetical protein
MADATKAIIASVVGVILTCANGWALYTINDVKSDVREIRGTVNTTSAALTGQINTLGQDMGKRIDAISAVGAQASSGSTSDLTKAILDTRSIVGKIEANTVTTAKELDAIRVSLGNLTQTVSFMQGQLSQAPWVKK